MDLRFKKLWGKGICLIREKPGVQLFGIEGVKDVGRRCVRLHTNCQRNGYEGNIVRMYEECTNIRSMGLEMHREFVLENRPSTSHLLEVR